MLTDNHKKFNKQVLSICRYYIDWAKTYSQSNKNVNTTKLYGVPWCFADDDVINRLKESLKDIKGFRSVELRMDRSGVNSMYIYSEVDFCEPPTEDDHKNN